MPAIDRTETVAHTPFCDFVAKHLAGADGGEPYYAVTSPDYVCIVARTETGRFLLVRQYRPAVEGETLELPAGTVEPGETPEDAAARELLEETGHAADRLESLGWLWPDTGRLANRMWCFFADNVRPTGAGVLEDGIACESATPDELAAMIRRGAWPHALHLAALHRAILDGWMPPLPPEAAP